MTVTFRQAKREALPLLIGFAGGTGSGKTYSGLLTASGIANGHPFAGIDTENRRMNHYADQFPLLRVAQITAPFRPEAYTAAIEAGAAYLASEKVPAVNRVVLVDSMSHEWAGDGGCLDWHAELTGGQASKNQQGWAKVKPAHKRMVSKLLQIDAHIILCFRAEPKLEEIDDPDKPGKKKWVAKRSVTAIDGWFPITEKMLPYELTASFLLMADAPGVPKPIKLEEQHKPFVPLDRPLSAETGRRLAEWAAGGEKDSAPGGAHAPTSPPPGDDPATGAEPTLFAPPAAAVELAGQAHPPIIEGVTEEAAGRTLEQILAMGEPGEKWLDWAARTAIDRWPEDFRANLLIFCAARLPALVAA